MKKAVSFGILFLSLLCGICKANDTLAPKHSTSHNWYVNANVAITKSWPLQYPICCNGSFERLVRVSRINFQIETAFDFCKYANIALSIGFQHYDYMERQNIDVSESAIKQSFAPVFGLSMHLHLLPFFVKKTCRWDLYVSTLYNGCWHPHLEFPYLVDIETHYRQTYGAGIGLAFYFKNRIGLFGEYDLGQFSLCKTLINRNYNLRFGLTCKI